MHSSILPTRHRHAHHGLTRAILIEVDIGIALYNELHSIFLFQNRFQQSLTKACRVLARESEHCLRLIHMSEWICLYYHKIRNHGIVIQYGTVPCSMVLWRRGSLFGIVNNIHCLSGLCSSIISLTYATTMYYSGTSLPDHPFNRTTFPNGSTSKIPTDVF